MHCGRLRVFKLTFVFFIAAVTGNKASNMAVTVDEMLEQIGSFGRYQWILLSICGYAMIVATALPTMIASFITAEPDWICVKGYNNSACNFTEPITLTSENYNARCSMPREAWIYVEDFTSTVTEV